MNKGEVAARLRQVTGLSGEEANIALEAVLTPIKESLTRGENVTLFRSGTFAVKKRRARITRNPRTGEQFKAPAKSFVVFRTGEAFREEIQEAVVIEKRD